MNLALTFAHERYSDQALNESIAAILTENNLGAMASVRGAEAYINTAYFVYSDDLSLYFLSQRGDTHSGNVDSNPSVAVAVWAATPRWGEDLRGLQLFGECEMLSFGTELIKGMQLFARQFPAFSSLVKHPGEFAEGVTSRMYRIRVSALKLIDEPRFGRRNYIYARPIAR
jgi:uncharacterized protein YhbP (UPF0306 family)